MTSDVKDLWQKGFVAIFVHFFANQMLRLLVGRLPPKVLNWIGWTRHLKQRITRDELANFFMRAVGGQVKRNLIFSRQGA